MYQATTAAIPVARFRPDAEGLDRWFGPTEAMIMDIMWNSGVTASTVKRMHRALLEDHGHDVAYTTVMTTMSRLYEKGILQREKSGYTYVYAVRCSQLEYETMQLGAIVRSIGQDAIEQHIGVVVARRKEVAS